MSHGARGKVTFHKRRTKGNTPNPDAITRQPMWWTRYAHNTGNWRSVVAQMRKLEAEARTTRIKHGLDRGQREYT
jgi:hypothetical protein